MSINDSTPQPELQSKPKIRKSRLPKGVRVVLWSVFGVVILIIAALFCITWYLTPDRLSSIISDEMSSYFNADVRVRNVRFTFWSTFPRFTIETDSIDIISHTLDNQPEDILKQLPSDARFLASAEGFRGGINMMKFFAGRYDLHDMNIDGLRLNIVSYNDSINNYDILPVNDTKDQKVPFFTSNVITLSHPHKMKAFFAATSTRAEIELDSVVMRRLKEDTDYDLAIRGKLSANTQNFNLLDRFPFGLDGNMKLHFRPFGLKFTDFNIDLGSIKGDINMNMDLEGDVKINDFDYHLDVLNLMKLLNSLPWLKASGLTSLRTDLDISATARLTSPYNFSSVELPSLEVDFKVPEGNLTYALKQGEDYTFRHGDVTGRLIFDGKNPSASHFDFSPIIVEGNGLDCALSGNVINLLDSPKISAEVKASADLEALTKTIPALVPFGIQGDMKLDALLSFGLESLTTEGLEQGMKDFRFEALAQIDKASGKMSDLDMEISDGKVEIHTVGMPADMQHPFDVPVDLSLKAGALRVESPGIDMQGVLLNVSGSTTCSSLEKVTSLSPQLAVSADGLHLEVADKKIDLSGLEMNTTLPQISSGRAIPRLISFSSDDLKIDGGSELQAAVVSLKGDLAIDTSSSGDVESAEARFTASSLQSSVEGMVNVKASSLAATMKLRPEGGLDEANLSASSLALNGMGVVQMNLKDFNLSSSFQPSAAGGLGDISARLKTRGLNLNAQGSGLALNNVDLAVNYKDGKKYGVKGSSITMENVMESQPDARSLSFAPHSDVFATAGLSPDMVKFVRTHDLSLSLKSSGGTISTSAFPGNNSIGNLDLSLSLDSINLRSLNISSGATAARLSGRIGNLRDFLMSATPVRLPIDVNVALDTININQLARSYVKGRENLGIASSTMSPEESEVDDAVTRLIPRNIDAKISFSALQSIYMDLHLYDILGCLSLKDGVARVDDFNVSAEFGRAHLGAVYDTSDMQNMSLTAKMALEDINVVSFFDHFHALLLMMPEMKNLEGNVSLTVDGKVLLFPDMDLNMPSITAAVDFKGWGLTLHQNKFIHRLARKLLIRTDSPLHIADIDIRARVRDNLLEIYPFELEMSRYKIKALGTNNFDGDLYYHLDVEKSPLPFPFGINVDGHFHNPRIRVGRPGYSRKKAEGITTDIMISNKINVVKEAKHYMKVFVRKAADSASS